MRAAPCCAGTMLFVFHATQNLLHKCDSNECVPILDSKTDGIGIGPISIRRRQRRIDIGTIAIRVLLLSGVNMDILLYRIG